MSQDGQGYGAGEQAGSPSWRPQDAGEWSPPAPSQGAAWQGQSPAPAPTTWPVQPPPPQVGTWGAPPPGGYPHPGYLPPGQQPTAATPAIAVVGFVLAILLAPIGLVVSLVALGPTKRAGSGRGLAVAGSIVGGVLTVVGIVGVVALVPMIGSLAAPGASVLRLDAAVENSDCDEFMATSTRAFRSDNELTTCDDFTAFVAGDGYRDNQVRITGVEIVNGVATVRTTETYLWLEDGETYTDRFSYRVVKEDGAWRVDGIDLVEQ